MRKIKQVVLHCSDSQVRKHNDINIIKLWHIARGFKTVGYHYFIQENGTIQRGRDEKTEGAHCLGANTDSIGICLHGKTEFTRDQFRSLAALLEALKMRHGLTNRTIKGHNEYQSAKDQGKTCPNFDVAEFKKAYMIPDPKTKKDGKGHSGSDKGFTKGSKTGPAGSAGQKPKGSKGTSKE